MGLTALATSNRNRRVRSARMLMYAVAFGATLSACGNPAQSTGAPAGTNPVDSTAAATVTATAAPSLAAKDAGQAATTDQIGGKNLCFMVSPQEAETILGTSVAAGVSKQSTHQFGLTGNCIYTATTSGNQHKTLLNLVVLGTKIPRALFDQEVASSAADRTPVSGLGETAFAVPGLVTVFDHGLVLALEAIQDQKPLPASVITPLLAKALSRAGELR